MRAKVVASIISVDGSDPGGCRQESICIGLAVEYEDEVGLGVQTVCDEKLEIPPSLHAFTVDVCHKRAVVPRAAGVFLRPLVMRGVKCRKRVEWESPMRLKPELCRAVSGRCRSSQQASCPVAIVPHIPRMWLQ